MMTQHRLSIESYAACAILAIGSLGPWVNGPLRGSGTLSYSGVSGNGILTLLGAGLVALVIWRWTISRRRSMLIVAQGIAFLCALVAIYAIYDVYDFYSDVSEAGIDRVGWGLILALVAAMVLFVLCLLQYLRTGSERAELR